MRGATGPIAMAGGESFSPASAMVGPFTSTRYFSRQLGNVMSLDPGNSQGCLFQYDSVPTATANIFGCNTSTSGQELQINNAGNMFFVSRRAATQTFGFGLARFGVMHVLFSRLLSGELRAYFNGGPGQQLNATLTGYVLPSGTAVTAVGRNNPAINVNAFTTGQVLALYQISAAVTETEGRLMTSCTRLDRWHCPSEVTAHASLLWQLAYDRDWNGVAATVTAGLGSAPITLDALGAPVPVKTAIPRYRYKPERQQFWHDSKTYVFGAAQQETPHHKHNPFGQLEFQTDATQMVVDFAVTAASVQPAYLGVGIYVNGVLHDTPIVGQYTMDGSRDVATMAAGTKTIRVVDGLQNLSGGVVKCIATIAVRVPEANTLAVQLPASPSRRLVFYGDSITVGSITTNVQANAYCMITRANYPGRTTVEGYGSRGLNSDCATAGDRTNFAAYMATLCDGTTENILVVEVQLNDFQLAMWSAASYGTALADFLDKLRVLVPGIIVYLRTALTSVNQAVPNVPFGNVLADYRTQSATVQSTRSTWVTIIDGPTLVTYPANFDADGIHLNNAGGVQAAAGLQAAIGF